LPRSARHTTGTVLLRTEPGGRWASTELRKTLRACWSPSLPSPSPWASSCTRIPARVFSSPLRATAGGIRARFGSSVPRHGLNEPSRREVRIEFGDLVHVGTEPLRVSAGLWLGKESRMLAL